jgi:aminoglycoside phosphotransferase (APT) family kinase protein
MGTPAGVCEAVDRWLEDHIDTATAPFDYTVIAGGHSNLTYAVRDAAGNTFVLRRPPLGHRLSGAHDMAREHRLISALGPTLVPVPRVLGLCEDPAVNELPFYVMEWVDGHVIRDATTAESLLSPEARRRASHSLIETLVALHSVDPDAVGLSDLGRREDYIARQLHRWSTNLANQRTREVPLLERVHDELAARIPEQRETVIVHGDFRLDNTMVDDDGNVVAVLDWEICTLGDPLADLGLLMVYWNGPGDPVSAWPNPASSLDGFLGRRELARLYGESSGRDVSGIDYYFAFGFWKLACIIEGVHARYLGGALGPRDPEELAPFVTQGDEAARMAAESLGIAA